jgi:hypothetical protein
MLFVFQTFFTEKNGEKFKSFSPLLSFLLNFSPQTHKIVKLFWVSLVGRFKIFSTIYGEKCCLFFRHFSLKKVVKNLNLFHLFWASVWIFHLELTKWWKCFEFFTTVHHRSMTQTFWNDDLKSDYNLCTKYEEAEM